MACLPGGSYVRSVGKLADDAMSFEIKVPRDRIGKFFEAAAQIEQSHQITINPIRVDQTLTTLIYRIDAPEDVTIEFRMLVAMM